MNDLREIKDRLRNNPDNLVKILESIECEKIHFEQGGKILKAQLPSRFNSNNNRAVEVRLTDNLSCKIRNRQDFKKGDIYNLISYIHHDKRTQDDIQDDLFYAKKLVYIINPIKILGFIIFKKSL